MFQNPRYITRGIVETLSPELTLLLWQLVDEMPSPKDYLQVFQISPYQGKQKIVHTQEQPPCARSLLLSLSVPIYAKVYIIDDATHSTMLLAEEY